MSKAETNVCCIDNESTISSSVQTVHLNAHNSLAVVKTKVKLDSHADTCVVSDHAHDHNRPVTFVGYDPKSGSNHACIVDATVAYTEPETGCVVILMIKQAIEIKCLYHHLFCLMQCCMYGVLIDEVLKFLASILSETTHAKQLENPFDATHLFIIHLKLNEVSSYYEEHQLNMSIRARISSR